MSGQTLFAVNKTYAGECRRDYIGKGRKAERFESAKGLANTRRQHHQHRRMPAGLQVEQLLSGRRSLVQIQFRATG
jgi:hypothetical protein